MKNALLSAIAVGKAFFCCLRFNRQEQKAGVDKRKEHFSHSPGGNYYRRGIYRRCFAENMRRKQRGNQGEEQYNIYSVAIVKAVY